MLNPVQPYQSQPHTAEQGLTLVCEDCGEPYHVKRDRPDRRSRRLCISCRGKAGAAVSDISAGFTRPESEDVDRMRAQAVVNMRLRRGWFTKPSSCCLCPPGAQCDRLVAHHEDYSKPTVVHWICDNHHYQVHRDPSLLNGVPAFHCDRINLPPVVRHSKGGRRGSTGPTGKALGHSPKRNIRETVTFNGTVTEILSCGHQHSRRDDGQRPYQRRCRQCVSSPASSPAIGGTP